jgi:hypothetical protein
MNSRGQNIDKVEASVIIGEERETHLIDYCKSFGVDLTKSNNKYKHYDFLIGNNKYNKIELKSVNASSSKYEGVLIGIDKIAYYLYRKVKNENMRFYLIYAFYNNNDETNTLNIEYKYIKVDFTKFIQEYKRKIYFNKKHICIPVSDLKPIKHFVKYAVSVNNIL